MSRAPSAAAASLVSLAVRRPRALPLVNVLLPLVVPFNAPHGFKLRELSSTAATVVVPFRRRNKNHLGSLHACALATGCELAAGLLLSSSVDLRVFRLIMRRLQIDFEHQARTAARVTCGGSRLEDLSASSGGDPEGVTVELLSEASDTDGRIVCRALTTWQLKPWSAVRSVRAE